MTKLSTPVAFIIFNRPDLAQIVFNSIRQAQPEQLFVIADGARFPEEHQKCQQARDIIQQVDWNCQVLTNYADTNLGCRQRVSSGITWVFEQVEEAIILEDDCLPSHSFFVFCQYMLERYRNDKRVMIISGYNKQQEWKANQDDYFFSYLGGIWGWASWRRAWNHFDIDMKDLDHVLHAKKLQHLLGEQLGKIREKQLLELRENQIDTWDYQWGFARHINSGMAVVSSKSLIKNIGFREDATHTKQVEESQILNQDIDFPLKDNNIVVADSEYDLIFFQPKNLSFKHKILSQLKFCAKKIKNRSYEICKKFDKINSFGI
jgi:hypothetical protein